MSAPLDIKLFDIQAATPLERTLAGILHLDSEVITVRELIRQRVMQEVNNHNQGITPVTSNLVQPSEAEQPLNKSMEKQNECHKRRQINLEKQVEKALQAFSSNGFFVLVDDHQVENLDEELVLMETSEVSFFKLVPLVGG